MKRSAKNKLIKIKNIILKIITYIMTVLFILSLIALDSESIIPFITLVLSGGWLALVGYANGYID